MAKARTKPIYVQSTYSQVMRRKKKVKLIAMSSLPQFLLNHHLHIL